MKQMILLIAGLLLLSPAFADEESVYNRVSISAEASAEVENDTLFAELYIEHQAKTAAGAAEVVNAAIEWGLGQAQSVKGIKVRTLEYNTTPVYSKARKAGEVYTPQIMEWRVSQAMRVESTDADALSELITGLQEKLAIRQIGYEVSEALREATESVLIDEAIRAYQQRAQQVAKAFGHDDFRLVKVNINSGGMRPPVPYQARSMAMEAAAAAPVAIDAGTSTLKINVNGTIELQ
ncbi:MAG: SIMPL domain-containing protein [Chromatiales bacterium]|jgi:predicted secreted protein